MLPVAGLSQHPPCSVFSGFPSTPDGQQREALAILLKFPSGYQVSYSTGALQTGAQSGKQVPANGHDNPAPGPSFESEVNEQSDRARASSDQK